MKYILDSDTISYYLKDPKENFAVFRRIESLDDEDLATTAINYAEILFGFHLRGNTHGKEFKAVEHFFKVLEILPLTEESVRRFAKLKASLTKKGEIIPDMDLMIASTVMTNDLTLVTHNTKHFARIDGLNLEDWTI